MKSFIKGKYSLFFLLLLLTMLPAYLHAQNQSRITLIDKEEKVPVEAVSFRYGAQSGTSSALGEILFTIVSGETMYLSHLSYGSWAWTEKDLQHLIQNKTAFIVSVSKELYPVTIIALRQETGNLNNIPLQYDDKLQHDGGAILLQHPEMNAIRKSGNYGFDPVFRGFKYDQVSVLYHGAQSASAACPNRMDPPVSQMAPNMTERIEIFKGPYALRYGAAVGALINFAPRELQFSASSRWTGRLSTGYESNGQIFRSEGMAGLRGRKYDISLLAAYSQGKDYTSGNGTVIPGNFERRSIGADIGIGIGKKQQLRLTAFNNYASNVDFPALPMDLRKDNTWMFQVRHDFNINRPLLKKWSTSLYGSLVDHQMDNLLKVINPRTVNSSTPSETTNYGGRTEGKWQFKKARLFAGADFRYESAAGSRTRTMLTGPNAGKVFTDSAWQDSYISKAALFGEYSFTKKRTHVVFSGRLEWNFALAEAPSVSFTKNYPVPDHTTINPSFSAGLIRNLGKSWQFSWWMARVERSGSLTEKFINFFPVGKDAYEILGNPGIKPEINYQTDVMFKWSNKQHAVSVDLFLSWLSNNISAAIDTSLKPRLATSPGVRRFVNIDKALKTGFELSWVHQPTAWLKQQAGIAYTYAQDLDVKAPLPETAPLDFRYTLSGIFLKQKLSPELGFRYVMKQSRISRNFGETPTASFAVLDFSASYILSEKIRVSAGVNNLLDKNYYEHLSRFIKEMNTPVYSPGRNFYIRLSATY